ncbi:MAG TPA: lysylphosphatidylglycerol synthase transmembrane domain-containing protein [Gaiellaceae bacterium]|nr:lysylphosphatidylglycerol synthase transmembrane domain-containing protein [Gaiellaceae bacterium]
MDDVRGFLDACQAFFDTIASVALGPLALAVSLHVLKLLLRGRAWQNILRASYPNARIRYWGVFGSYMAGVGVNSLAPARGGDLVKLYLVKRRVKDSSYPTLASSLVVETLFDFVISSALFIWAIKLGLLPGVPDLPAVPAFDWSFVVRHPVIAAFIGCVLLGLAIVGAAWASRRVNEFREKLALGFAILHDRRAFLTGVVTWQAASWLARGAAVYFFLEAFRIPASIEATVTVLVVQGLSTLLPFTPGGAGTQQAVLVYAFAGTAAASTVLGFSVGMQLVTIAVNVVLGFGALAIMLRTLHWRQHVFAPGEGLAPPKKPPPGEPSAPPVPVRPPGVNAPGRFGE